MPRDHGGKARIVRTVSDRHVKISVSFDEGMDGHPLRWLIMRVCQHIEMIKIAGAEIEGRTNVVTCREAQRPEMREESKMIKAGVGEISDPQDLTQQKSRLQISTYFQMLISSEGLAHKHPLREGFRWTFY